MDYSEYSSPGTEIREYMAEVSDGVTLRIIDFTPTREEKDTPLILFVAGWISLISGWKGVMKSITPRFRTLYLETREKKSSVVPVKKKVSYTIKRLTEDLKNVIDCTIPEGRDFVLAGSSLGATAILEYLALHHRDPLCAILIAPNPEFRFPKILGDLILALTPPSLYHLIKPLIKWYLRNFRLDKKREQEQIKKYETTLDEADPYKLKANAKALKTYKIWDILEGITAPCLFIGATSDTLHGTTNIKRLMNLIPRSVYRELASNKETHSEKAGELMIDFISGKEYDRI